MADGTEQRADDESVGWPLVERRRTDRTPPGGLDRRTIAAATAPALRAATIWPFRLAAVVGSIVRAEGSYSWHHWKLIVVTLTMCLYTAYVCVHPLPYHDDGETRRRVVLEQALNTAAVMLTGLWASPFVLFLIPTGMVAGFASGAVASGALSAASVIAVTARFIPDVGARAGLKDGALWAGLLGLVAFTSGLAHSAANDAQRQHQVALDRVSRLAEANALLFSLQRVAQTLPASLDLDEVLDSTVARLRAMVRHDSMAVFLLDAQTGHHVAVRTHGIDHPPEIVHDALPRVLRIADESPTAAWLGELRPGEGISPGSRSGLYTALRARGALIGFLALESEGLDQFGRQQAEVVHGLGEPFGIAVDNARMFLRIRTLAADEERSRIARELHDHVGSSLAMIGYEVDRAMTVSNDGGEVQPVLRELREQVSLVVKDVRNTLFDMRTEVTDARDLATTATQFLRQVQQRSGLRGECRIELPARLALTTEREVWQILKEAVINAERHSHGTRVEIVGAPKWTGTEFVVRDDGVGVDSTTARPDSYGMAGMRERAHRLDAELTVRSLPMGGTEVRLLVPPPGVPR